MLINLANQDTKLIAIGTLPASEEHWFARMFAAAMPHVHTLLFTHNQQHPNEKLWKKKYWLPVNPLATHNEHLMEVLTLEAHEAKAGIGLDSFKALRLNMGVPEVEEGEALLPHTSIEACTTDTLPPATGGHVLGIDLGSRTAYSAATAVYATGRCTTACIYPPAAKPPPGLANEPTHCAIQSTTPIPSAEELLRLAQHTFGTPEAIFSDNYRTADLETACTTLGLPEPCIQHDTVIAHEFVTHLRATTAQGKLKWIKNGMIHAAIKQARMTTSKDGFQKMARHTQAGRSPHTKDDAIAALLPAAYYQAQALAGNYTTNEVEEE